MSRDLSHLITPLKAHFSDESWEVWLEEISGLAQNTIYNYSRCLIEFLEFKGMTPEDLETEYKTQLDSDDKKIRKKLGREIKSFMNGKVGEGQSRSRAEMYLKALRSFMNSMGLPSVKVNGLEKVVSAQQDTATKAHIKLMMENTTNPRNRAVIMVCKDTGLRISDIAELKIKYFTKALENGDAYCNWKMITLKEKIPAYPVVGHESLKYIREWLRIREKMGFPNDPDSPLFCKMKLENGEVIAVNSDSIANTIRKITQNAEIPEITAHSLRRFHTSNLASQNMNQNYIKLLQGKSLGKADSSYYDPSKLIEMYPKFYHILSVFSKEIDRTEMNGLKAKNAELLKRLSELENKLERNESMFSDMGRLLVSTGLVSEDKVESVINNLIREKELA